MSAEYDALLRNHIWILVPKNSSQNIVDCRWIFKIKHNSDGSVERYKARLVTNGFTQRPGIDFHDTFNPVVKPTTIHLVLSVGVQRGWSICQLDVNNAFLQGRLEEEVYMRQPPGFASKQHSDYILTTSMSSSLSLTIDSNASVVDVTAYRRILGKLQYLSFTRLDISFVVNKLAQFMHHPQQLHWQAVKRLLRYLKHTAMFGLYISSKSDNALYAYSDSDWAGNLLGRTSTIGYVLYYGDTPISWSSKKQKTVARSSKEAKYRVVASSVAELNWVMNLLTEVKLPVSSPPPIFCDNIGATYLCHNPVFHSRMKHITLNFHFVGDQVQRKLITVHHINSLKQVADLLTKPLSKSLFQKQFSKLGLVDTLGCT
ncbi:hypothetical protein AgCh_033153 [Apium graveolens]